MQLNATTRYYCFIKVLSFIAKLNFNSCFLLREFQKLHSAFKFVDTENRFDQEYEVLAQIKEEGKHLLVRDADIVYETSDWVDSLIKLQEFFLDDFIGFTRDQYYLLHSAIVVKNGKAILLPGASRSGKSTLCIALLKNGFKYISDEIAAIDLKTFRASGFPRAISIREKTLRLFPTLNPEINCCQYQLLNTRGISKICYGIPYKGNLASMNKFFPLSAIVFPKYNTKGRTVLHEVSHSSLAIYNLMECSINQLWLKEKGFRTATGLVKRTNCYNLQTNNLAEACEIINRII